METIDDNFEDDIDFEFNTDFKRNPQLRQMITI